MQELITNYNTNSDVLLYHKSKYIPTYLVADINRKSNRYKYYSILSEEDLKKIRKLNFNENLKEVLLDFIFKNKNYSDSKVTLYEIINELHDVLNTLIEVKTFNLYTTHYYSRLYFTRLNIISKGYYQKDLLKIIINPYFLAYQDESVYPTILYSLVIKKEYLEYYRLCLLTDSFIDFNIFEFHVYKGFDTKEFPNRSLRSFYRKKIKPFIKQMEIPIVEVDNLTKELYQSVEQPVCKTITEYKNYYNTLFEDFVKSLN